MKLSKIWFTKKTKEKSDPHHQSSFGLESAKPIESNTETPTRPSEEEREQSGGEQEQKSFRKRKNYDSQDKPKANYNNQKYGNRNQDNYSRGRNSGSKYQYTTTYYEKKANDN